jgi:Zinc finger, C3HC4 type (RING finger)
LNERFALEALLSRAADDYSKKHHTAGIPVGNSSNVNCDSNDVNDSVASSSSSGSSGSSCVDTDDRSSKIAVGAGNSDTVLGAVTATTESTTAAFDSSTIGDLGEHIATTSANNGSATAAFRANGDSVCQTIMKMQQKQRQQQKQQQQQQQHEQHRFDADNVTDTEYGLLDEHKLTSAEPQTVSTLTQAAHAKQMQREVDVLKQQLAERDNTISSLSQQLHSERDARLAEVAAIENKLLNIAKRNAQLTAAVDKTESIKRELRTLRKRDAEHDAALQQCRDAAAAAVAAVTAQLQAATAQLDEHEERSTCVVCQCEAKTVLLQPCLHLCLCIKCSTSPKLKDCPICRAAIEYKETVHLC